MSFYIISNGNLTEMSFDYLSKESGSRLEGTLGGNREVSIKRKSAGVTYAIEIMSSPVVSLEIGSTAKEALKSLVDHSIHHIVLVKGDKVRGLISDRDLSWLKKLKIDELACVSQFMSTMILACDEETPLDHLAKVMVKEHVSALPIVNKNLELTGIVTHHDILKWLF
jgi:CBS domain-containing protein